MNAARGVVLAGSALAFAAIVWLAESAHGQTKPPAASASASPSASVSTSPPAAVPVVPQRAISAVSKVADAIAQQLGTTPAQALVVTAAATSDPPAPKSDKLALAIAAQIAGRVGNAARIHSEPAALAMARAAASSSPALIHLVVEIAAGKLRVTANVYPVPQTVWAKIRDPEPAPTAHAFAEAPIDAEVRSYLPPIPLVATQLQVERGRNYETDVVALACGDLDRDGSSELAIVSRRRITTARIRAGKVEPLRGRAWSDVAAVSPAPLREPYAFATLVERGNAPNGKTTLDVALSDRAASVRFDRGLEVDATFAGLALPDGAGTACTRLAAMVVTGALGACKKGDPSPLAPSVGGQYDAFASAAMIAANGAPYVVWAGRERGLVELRDDAGHAVKVDALGAQLALGDLDQDGDPELLGSVDTLNALDDAVIVKTWRRATGKVEERLRIPAAAGVRALGVCPPDGAGHTPFVVATADEIWVAR